VDAKKLSAAKLLAAIDAQDRRVRAFVDAMIDAGRGHETMSVMRAAAAQGHDPLAHDYCAAMSIASDLEHERARRLRYHGKLSPVRSDSTVR
jgi:hypothetical protein